MAGILAYTVPSAAEIFSTPLLTRDYYSFDGRQAPFAGVDPSGLGPNLINFEVTVQNGQEIMRCPTKFNQCRLRYDEAFTPMYVDTVPSNVAWGMKINMVMNPNRCHNDIPADYEPFQHLKIGNILTEYEGLIDSSTRLSNWSIGAVSTIVGKNDPQRDAKPDANFSRVGRARLMESSRHCSFDGTDCWTIRVHPKIDSVSAATGYINGGQTLVIKGWGL